jgi:DNA-binding transcriptional ArsR family regulator
LGVTIRYGMTMLFSEEQVEYTCDILKSIAHPIRMKILCFIMDGEKNVTEIEGEFHSTISNISQHLTILRKANIIARRKEANFMFYSIKDPCVQTLIRTLKELYCSN